MGGWEQAAQLPAGDALAIAAEHLRQETRDALCHAQLCYCSSLPLYANGGTPPEPPEIKDEDDEF